MQYMELISCEDLCMVLSASYHCSRKPTSVASLQAGVDSTMQDPAFQHSEAGDTVEDCSHSLSKHRNQSQFSPQVEESSQEEQDY
jgi:hypothetical protein